MTASVSVSSSVSAAAPVSMPVAVAEGVPLAASAPASAAMSASVSSSVCVCVRLCAFVCACVPVPVFVPLPAPVPLSVFYLFQRLSVQRNMLNKSGSPRSSEEERTRHYANALPFRERWLVAVSPTARSATSPSTCWRDTPKKSRVATRLR